MRKRAGWFISIYLDFVCTGLFLVFVCTWRAYLFPLRALALSITLGLENYAPSLVTRNSHHLP